MPFSEMVNKPWWSSQQRRVAIPSHVTQFCIHFIWNCKKHVLHLCDPKEGFRLRCLAVLMHHSTVLWDTPATKSQVASPLLRQLPSSPYVESISQISEMPPRRTYHLLRTLNPKTNKKQTGHREVHGVMQRPIVYLSRLSHNPGHPGNATPCGKQSGTFFSVVFSLLFTLLPQ